MTPDNASTIDESWAPGGWRERATVQLSWFSIAIAILPLAISFFQGMSFAPIYGLITLLFVIAAILPTSYARPRAALMIGTWALLSFTASLGASLASPTATLIMGVYSAMLVVFFSVRGLFVSIAVTVLIVTSILVMQFGFGLSFVDDSATTLLDPAIPSNVIRMSITAVTFVALLTFAVSHVVRQQENAMQLLKEETSDRLAAERAFQEAQKAKLVTQMTSGLAHNFGNTLMVITTWAELIRRHPDDAEILRRGMEDVATASVQAAAIARQIMVVGKTYVRSMERVNLRNELTQQIALATTLLPNTIVIDEDFEDTPDILVDRSELQQGVLNLLLNARDALGTTGSIKLKLWSSSGRVAMSVTDDGEGMSPETLDRVFEPFFTTKGVHGTGLGLASLKQSVGAANGTIDIVSSPGNGTTFTLAFPALPSPTVAATDPADIAATRANASRILVVEDEEMVRDVIATALRSFGHDVIEATDITDGIAKVGEFQRIELMITDAVMPGGRLTDLLEAFEARYPHSPIMVCSGYMRDDVGARFIESRGIEFVQKPVDFDDLRTKVERMLAEGAQRGNV